MLLTHTFPRLHHVSVPIILPFLTIDLVFQSKFGASTNDNVFLDGLE